MKKLFCLIIVSVITSIAYAQTYKSMKVWSNGSYSTFNISEVDSVTYSEEEKPGDVVIVVPDRPSENMLNESQAQAYVARLYALLRDFMVSEQLLESIALGKTTGYGYEITPGNSHIVSAFQKAYATINPCNHFIHLLETSNAQFDRYAYIAHAWCIRALVYYSLAKLWGDVPYYEEPITSVDQVDSIKQVPAKEILAKCCQDFGKASVVNNIYNFGSNAAFNSSNIRGLYLETLYEAHGGIEIEKSSIADMYITDNEMNVAVKVCDDVYYKLFVRSLNYLHNIEPEQKDDIAKEYMNLYPHFGIWHSLKRLGMAPRYNGMAECNLFPIPLQETNLKQNPGY